MHLYRATMNNLIDSVTKPNYARTLYTGKKPLWTATKPRIVTPATFLEPPLHPAAEKWISLRLHFYRFSPLLDFHARAGCNQAAASGLRAEAARKLNNFSSDPSRLLRARASSRRTLKDKPKLSVASLFLHFHPLSLSWLSCFRWREREENKLFARLDALRRRIVYHSNWPAPSVNRVTYLPEKSWRVIFHS